MRRLSWLVPLLLVPFSNALAAEGRAASDYPAIARGGTSCFDGNWRNESAFIEMLKKNNPALKKSTEGQQRAKEYYRRTRDEFECRWFDYVVDGLSVRGFYARPKKIQGELPVVIFNRGGNADTGAIRSPYIFGKLFPVVKEGYVVVGSMYRGARLNDESVSPDRLTDEFGGRDVNDVLALLPIIDTMPFANKEKIAVWGVSRGGMMAYLSAQRSDRFRALIAEATPVDLVSELEWRPEMEKVYAEWIPGYQEDAAGQLKSRSALYWIEELPKAVPVLILHGTGDERVSPTNSLRMALKMQELGKPYRLVMFDGAGHVLPSGSVADEVVRWLDKKLREENRSPKPH